MPRKTALPEGVEQDTSTKKVRCQVCFRADPMSKGGAWMLKGSIQGHLSSAGHDTVVRDLADRQRAESARTQAVRDTYHRSTIAPPTTSTTVQPQTRPAMFSNPSISESFPPSNVYSTTADIDVDMELPALGQFNSDEIQQAVQEQFAFLAEQAEHRSLFGPGTDDDEDDITLSDVAHQMQNLGFSDPDTVEAPAKSTPPDPAYAPYPNRTLLFLDVLDNLPRLRMSSAQIRFLLYVLRTLGVENIPSYDAFRKLQKELQEKCGVSTTGHTSSVGNKFYVNDIRETVAQTVSNPALSSLLQFYPEETEDGSVSEAWQAQRWQEFAASQRTPMYSTGLRRFFINEVSRLRDERLVIARDWVIRKGCLTACCSVVSLTSEGWSVSSATEVVPASNFAACALELREVMAEHPWSDAARAPLEQNPLRELAGDEDLYTVFQPIWSDDVSGNRSKQYNKHMNFYGSCANLPGQLLQQEFCVDFISTSPHASTAEQFSVIRDQVKATHTNPVRCFNAATNRMCRIRILIPSLPADNPQQAEESSHIGGNGNKGCRKCHAGGNHEFTESNAGYHSLHYAGVARSAEETRREIEEQLRCATHGVKKAVSDRQTDSGVKDKVAQYWIDILLQRCADIRSKHPERTIDEVEKELLAWLAKQPGDKMNPLLDLAGLDPTQDTPVEILHTILLGIMKYAWHLLHTSWSEADQALFGIRLQSTDIDGLNVPPIRAAYMMQYRNSLIGKHFKTLMQTMPFHLHGVSTPEQFQLVKAIGELGAVLWVHKINNMDQYLADLEVLIGNVLDVFDAVDPSKIVTKIKLHLLPHLIQDIPRFGPAIRNSTEIYECYNAIFRLCSVLSNHQAPSRDIAWKFSSMKRVKHILSGGFWLENDKPVQAAHRVRSLLKEQSVVQRHLGWTPPQTVLAGSVRAVSKAKAVLMSWEDTLASRTTDTRLTIKELGISHMVQWKSGVSVTSQAGDVCRVGSWVFAQINESNSPRLIGRISEILVSGAAASVATSGLVTLELFYLGASLHPEFDIPILTRTSNSIIPRRTCTLLSSELLFSFSVQHDCRMLNCPTTAGRAQRQEHEDTERVERLVDHVDDEHYLVNMYALHNASLLRDVLPRTLIQPKPLYPNREARHFESAHDLRTRNLQKRAAAAAKRKEKKTRNAAAKGKGKQKARANRVTPDPEEFRDSPELEDETEDEIDIEHSNLHKRRRIEE